MALNPERIDRSALQVFCGAVRASLEKLVRDTRADELIIVTDTYEYSDRIESYERVARIANNLNGYQISRRSSSLVALALTSRKETLQLRRTRK